MARSAAERTRAIGPTAVRTSRSSRCLVRAMKCTSPANARVTGAAEAAAPDVPADVTAALVARAPETPGEASRVVDVVAAEQPARRMARPTAAGARTRTVSIVARRATIRGGGALG